MCYALANDKTIELLSLSISLSFLSLSADLLRHPAPDALYIFRSLVFSGRSKSVLLTETYWNIFFLRAQTLAAHLTCSQSSRFQNLSLDLQFRTGYTAQLLSRPNIEHAWVVGLELPSPPPPPPLPPVSQETVLTGGKSSSSRVNRPVFGWTSAPPPR